MLKTAVVKASRGSNPFSPARVRDDVALREARGVTSPTLRRRIEHRAKGHWMPRCACATVLAMANEKMASGERAADAKGTKKAWRKPVVSVVGLRSTANSSNAGADGAGDPELSAS